ncbi:hypothetical protein [Kibdelosporangium phytohabitans]|uniref:Uncharacterized protein n=1 Tax=Kibdelosporangium phytohabitans TaxID=860235 RepID=A0A0N9I7S2_9PSEU|nr:hypothetical protein [Kibdelosporangium phytohabitans]ALG12197.1 hypothetical protein AOZ06_39840 [Kibdelosporangium phytohabitans]MBE1463729.1 hypothetical protein [Kibdelosporangium phytohabitans]
MTESWGGGGASAYRETAKGYIGALDGIAKECENTADGVTIAGVVVGTVRGLIFDMIASFISRVTTQALIAAATSVVSLGSSIAVFISSVLIDLGMLLAKIGRKLAKLLKGLSKLARNFADKSDNLKRAADKLSDRGQQLHNWADRPDGRHVPVPRRPRAGEGSTTIAVTSGRSRTLVSSRNTREPGSSRKGPNRSRIGRTPMTGKGSRGTEQGCQIAAVPLGRPGLLTVAIAGFPLFPLWGAIGFRDGISGMTVRTGTRRSPLARTAASPPATG